MDNLNKITTIHRLPDEVLFYIFDASFRKRASSVDKATLFLLSQVCSLWRRLIITNPRFWCDLCLFLCCPHQEKLAALWVQRSGIVPLNIQIRHRDICHDHDDDDDDGGDGETHSNRDESEKSMVEKIARAVKGSVGRWERLRSFYGAPSFFFNLHRDRIEDELLSCLHSLEVSYSRDYDILAL